MKKRFYLMFGFALLFAFSSVAVAENYDNNKFPSDQIISQNFNKMANGRTFLNLVGKYKTSDNTYEFYFTYQNAGKQNTGVGRLTSLDNGLWLFDYSTNVHITLLEK